MPICLIFQLNISLCIHMAFAGPSFRLHANYVRTWLDVGADLGVASDRLLEGTGLSADMLEQPAARVEVGQAGLIISRLHALSGCTDLGVRYGMRIRPSAHGLLGYAAMTCETLLDAIRVLNQHKDHHINNLDVQACLQRGRLMATFSDRHAFGAMRQLFYEGLLVTLCRHAAFLLGRPLHGWAVHVDWPQPQGFEASRLGLPAWHFNAARVQLSLPVSDLRAPLVLADPGACRQALMQVERDIRLCREAEGDDVVARVRRALEQGLGAGRASRRAPPDLPDVASALCLSASTLKRRLHACDTSFQAVLDDVRKRQAMELIRQHDWPIQEVAQQLGYSDPAAFTRAFKRWTGMRPRDLRLR